MANEKKSKLMPVKYPGPVRRVTVQWDGGQWKVVKEVRVDSMTLPEPAPLPDGEKSRGFWIEATNSKGEVFQREVIANPFLGMEQFGEDGKMSRLNHPPHDIKLELLLPDVPEVSQLHLVNHVLDRKAGAEKDQGLQRTVLTLGKVKGGGQTDHPGGHDGPGGHDH